MRYRMKQLISRTPILSSVLALLIVFAIVFYSVSSGTSNRSMMNDTLINPGEATMLHDVSDDLIIETHLDTDEQTIKMNQVNLERLETQHGSNSATSNVPHEYTQAHRFDNSIYDSGVCFIEESQTLISANRSSTNQNGDKFCNEGIVSDNQESGSFIEPQTETKEANTYAYDSSSSVVTIQVDTKAEIDIDLGNEEVLVTRDTNVKANDDDSSPLAEPRIKVEESDTGDKMVEEKTYSNQTVVIKTETVYSESKAKTLIHPDTSDMNTKPEAETEIRDDKMQVNLPKSNPQDEYILELNKVMSNINNMTTRLIMASDQHISGME